MAMNPEKVATDNRFCMRHGNLAQSAESSVALPSPLSTPLQPGKDAGIISPPLTERQRAMQSVSEAAPPRWTVRQSEPSRDALPACPMRFAALGIGWLFGKRQSTSWQGCGSVPFR